MELKPKIKLSVDKLVDELHKRISLLTSTNTRANLNEEAYQKVKDIITGNIHKDLNLLSNEDIINFKLEDIKTLLELIDLEENQANEIINTFENKVYSINNTSLKTRIIELQEYFDKIKKLLLNYINDYEDIELNQTELQSKKVMEYNRYIELFTSENFTDLFSVDEMNDLLKLMSNFGLPLSDRHHILEYIAIQNLQVPGLEVTQSNEEYINLYSQVMTKIGLFLEPSLEEVEIVKKELEKIDIDIDLIPSIALDIAKKNNLNGEKVKNIVTTLVLNSLFDGYTKAINQDETEDYIASFKEQIEDVLKIECDPEKPIILEATNILSEKQEFYLNSVDNDEDVSQYLDIVISDLEESGFDHETAVDLKTLPIIKSISDSLDKLARLDSNSEDYHICCENLRALITVYNNLMKKKESVSLK